MIATCRAFCHTIAMKESQGIKAQTTNLRLSVVFSVVCWESGHILSCYAYSVGLGRAAAEY